MAYASFGNFTSVYSVPGASQTVVEAFLARASTRLDEALGGYFTTPFSSNNQTAIDITVDLARWTLQLRTGKKDDSQELGEAIADRLKELREGNSLMVTNSSAILESTNAENSALGTQQGYKSVFDMREPLEQRVNPSLLDALDNEDVP